MNLSDLIKELQRMEKGWDGFDVQVEQVTIADGVVVNLTATTKVAEKKMKIVAEVGDKVRCILPIRWGTERDAMPLQNEVYTVSAVRHPYYELEEFGDEGWFQNRFELVNK